MCEGLPGSSIEILTRSIQIEQILQCDKSRSLRSQELEENCETLISHALINHGYYQGSY